MELGEKLYRARMEAHLSQRQLCGDVITRNMLSQIEHGTARPSMKTLQYLAARLGRSVSYFLEEDAAAPNLAVMTAARRLYDGGDWAGALEALADYRGPDELFDRERSLLEALLRLNLARQALDQGRGRYARELLEQELDTPYCAGQLERQRLLLLGRIPGQTVSARLPSLDEELLLRAREALAGGDGQRAARLLEAAEDQTTAAWQLCRGDVYLAAGDYAAAARCFHRAEPEAPEQTAPRLERCCRELGDYKGAYEYACKQRF